MKLSQCVTLTDGELVGDDCEFSAIATDTRSIKNADLFVALRGDNFDGHAFVLQAQQSGAAAVVVEHRVEGCTLAQLIVKDTTLALGAIANGIRQKFKGPLVAITGSCGKTSVKGLTKSIFEQVGKTLATQGNFNNHIGVPLTLNGLTAEHDFAVIEMGTSGKNEIAYLANLAEPSIALVNNIRAAHIGGFGSIDAIAQEKGTIYTALDHSRIKNSVVGSAVINLDDAFSSQYIKQTEHLKQLGFSAGKSDIRNFSFPCLLATDIATNAEGFPSFVMHYQSEKVAVTLNVLGLHFVNNALAASACAIAAGLSLDVIASGLQQYQGDNGRMQRLDSVVRGQKAVIIHDAYNANPGSVRAAIDFLAAQPTSIRLLVLGYMGELGEGETIEHTSVGLYAQEMGVTHLLAIGNLPRLAAEAFGGNAIAVANTAEAAEIIAPYLHQDATILLKGSHSAAVDDVLPILSKTSKGLSPC